MDTNLILQGALDMLDKGGQSATAQMQCACLLRDCRRGASAVEVLALDDAHACAGVVDVVVARASIFSIHLWKES